MTGPGLPEVHHRDLSDDELGALRQEAFELERKIVGGVAAVSKEAWALAAHVYRFHEGGCWGLLGYDTLEEFLAQPDVSMSRTQFFRLSKTYRDLVVVREIPISALEQIDPSKVHEVAAAISRGEVKVEDALADAEKLGARDLREKYRRNGGAPALPSSGLGEDGDGSEPGLGQRAPDDPDRRELDSAEDLRVSAEAIARAFHKAYERLAPEFGYDTRTETAVPWDDVPEPNRKLMIAVVTELIRTGRLLITPR